MLGIAGALGSALGNSIREGMEAAAQQRQQEYLAALQRAEEERIRYEAEQQRLAAEREAKHRQLLGALRGSLGNTELGLKGMESHTLELKTGTAAFGIPSNPSGHMKVGEETAGLSLKMPEEPKVPVGKPVDAATMDKVWADYHHAADEYAKADLRRQELEQEKTMADQIRREAEKKVKEQQARIAVIPNEQPNRKEEDDKLAKAERLLQQATDLDQKATQDLDKAKQDLKQAKLDLDRTEKERAKAEKSLAQAEQGQSK